MGNFVKKAFRVVAPIVTTVFFPPAGIMSAAVTTGLAAAGATALTGGNRKEIFSAGLGGAVGGVAGFKFGEANPIARYVGGSTNFVNATTGIGAAIMANSASSAAREAENLKRNMRNNIKNFDESANGSFDEQLITNPVNIENKVKELTTKVFNEVDMPGSFFKEVPKKEPNEAMPSLFERGRRFADPAKYVGLHNRSIAFDTKKMIKKRKAEEMARRVYLLHGRSTATT